MIRTNEAETCAFVTRPMAADIIAGADQFAAMDVHLDAPGFDTYDGLADRISRYRGQSAVGDWQGGYDSDLSDAPADIQAIYEPVMRVPLSESCSKWLLERALHEERRRAKAIQLASMSVPEPIWPANPGPPELPPA